MDTPRDGRGAGESLDDSVWIRGVDYVKGWRAADDAANEFNRAASDLDLGATVWAVPHTGPDGEPLVILPSEAVQLCALLLAALADFL
ncbi:hypothetical protein ABZ746_25965 [Streptomyces sp. NPDC020096]